MKIVMTYDFSFKNSPRVNSESLRVAFFGRKTGGFFEGTDIFLNGCNEFTLTSLSLAFRIPNDELLNIFEFSVFF
jgi:hypothetical protein